MSKCSRLARGGEEEVLFLNCAAVSLKRSMPNVSVWMFAEQIQEKQSQLMTWQMASEDDDGCQPDILFYFIVTWYCQTVYSPGPSQVVHVVECEQPPIFTSHWISATCEECEKHLTGCLFLLTLKVRGTFRSLLYFNQPPIKKTLTDWPHLRLLSAAIIRIFVRLTRLGLSSSCNLINTDHTEPHNRTQPNTWAGMLCLFVPDCNKSCLSLSFVSFSCYRKTIIMSDSKFKFHSLRNVDLVINYFLAPLFPIRCSSLRGN